MDNIVISFGTIVAIIMGIVQVAKYYLNKRWLPLLALIAGIALFYLKDWQVLAQNWAIDIFLGLIAGLSAMGIWSGTKNTITD